MASNSNSSTAPLTARDRALLAEIKDAKARAALRSWTDQHCALSDKIDTLKAQQDEIKNTKIEPLRDKLGFAKIETDEWFIARRPGRPSVDKEKLQRFLFERQVPMRLIQSAMAYATSSGKPYTEIKRRKQKENGDTE